MHASTRELPALFLVARARSGLVLALIPVSESLPVSACSPAQGCNTHAVVIIEIRAEARARLR
jgi:hypothetical protein